MNAMIFFHIKTNGFCDLLRFSIHFLLGSVLVFIFFLGGEINCRYLEELEGGIVTTAAAAVRRSGVIQHGSVLAAVF